MSNNSKSNVSLNIPVSSTKENNDIFQSFFDISSFKEGIIEQLTNRKFQTRKVIEVRKINGEKREIVTNQSGYFPISDDDNFEEKLPLSKAITLADYVTNFTTPLFSTTYESNMPDAQIRNLYKAAYIGLRAGQMLIDMDYKGSDTYAAEFAIWVTSVIEAQLNRNIGGFLTNAITSNTTKIVQTVQTDNSNTKTNQSNSPFASLFNNKK
ncbi:MAG: hypothetical protein ACP5L3_06560 [Caldisericum sp.]|uniref:hypothetical protein n=1 Tax=Caldisericum sp. TaxID=2499687 RepID=UPI003D0E0920